MNADMPIDREAISWVDIRIEDEPLKPILHQDRRITGVYLNAIRKLVELCYHNNLIGLGEIVGAFFAEPWQTFKSGLKYPLGWKADFDYYNLNPHTLNEIQAKHAPTLLLHGDHDNQAAWLCLAKKINEIKNIHLGPFYTIQLPHGLVTGVDIQLVNQKFAMIKEQYKKKGINDVRINIVGHSRGGEIISDLLKIDLENKPYALHLKLGKTIAVGAVVLSEIAHLAKVNLPNFQNRIFEIIGREDVVQGFLQTSLDESQCLELDLGHLELKDSDVVHNQIIEWLKEDGATRS